MQEFVDYIIETSNDEQISFLEAIEAVSKSCKEELNYEVQANIVENLLSGTSNKLNFSSVSPDHAKQINTVSSFTSALKGDDIDFFNITDCDLNLLVDPKTGKGLFDDESSEDEIQENIKPMPEECTTAIEVISLCASKEVGDLDIVSTEKEKIEQLKSSNKLAEELSLPKNNRVVLIQIGSSPNNASKIKKVENAQHLKSLLSNCEKYDKPPFSYSCLIAMALKNSEYGYLPVSEIYSYIIDKFPYFKTAPDGWKNSIRHNLSLNKCFQKLETPLLNGTSRKACLWGLNEAKVARLNEEISKWLKKSPENFGPGCGESDDLEMSQVTNTEAVTQISGSNKAGVQWTIKNDSSLKCSQDFKPFRLKNVDNTSTYNAAKSTSLNVKIKIEKEDMQFYDPLFTNFNSQAWDDDLETEKKPGILSYFAFSSKRPRISNDSTLSLKTVRASA